MKSVLSLPPLILDFDASVLPLTADEIRIDLQNMQEKIRFSSDWRSFRNFAAYLNQIIPAKHGPAFLGSGDYHHVSLLLLQRLSQQLPREASFDLLICDNHPDNMRFPFGIHCGSWVSHAALLPSVNHVHVLGISSEDITLRHCWENRLRPLIQKKLTYWAIGKNASWLDMLGLAECNKSFRTSEALLREIAGVIRQSGNIYLSVDKDVFSTEFVHTNWDQGRFKPIQLQSLIHMCAGKLIGADITGEVSTYDYKSVFKRLLTFMDGVKKPDRNILQSWQAAQQNLNKEILYYLREAGENRER